VFWRHFTLLGSFTWALNDTKKIRCEFRILHIQFVLSFKNTHLFIFYFFYYGGIFYLVSIKLWFLLACDSHKNLVRPQNKIIILLEKYWFQ
jgi:hypothetical protein